MKQRSKIVVVGSSNTDMILRLERAPRPGETLLGGAFSMAAGGKGANQAVAAARLGGEVTFIAALGSDVFGDQAAEGFKREGIALDYLKRVESEASGVALIFVGEDGENSIGVGSGANACLLPEDIAASAEAIASADAVILQLETPIPTVLETLKLARANGVRTILNPAPACELPDELLATLDVITPNETEVEALTGIAVVDETTATQAAKALIAKGIGTVIITLGKQGAFVFDGTEGTRVPTFEVERVLDTTAAGDTFNGALAVALCEGSSLAEAVRFANAAASLAVTRLGAQPSVPTREAVQQFLLTAEAMA